MVASTLLLSLATAQLGPGEAPGEPGGGGPDGGDRSFTLSPLNPQTWDGNSVSGNAAREICNNGVAAPQMRTAWIPVAQDTATYSYAIDEEVPPAQWHPPEEDAPPHKRPPYERDGFSEVTLALGEGAGQSDFNPEQTGHPDWRRPTDVPTLHRPLGPEHSCRRVIGPDNNYEGSDVCRFALYYARSREVTFRLMRKHVLIEGEEPNVGDCWAACSGCGGGVRLARLHWVPSHAFHDLIRPPQWNPAEVKVSDLCE